RDVAKPDPRTIPTVTRTNAANTASQATTGTARASGAAIGTSAPMPRMTTSIAMPAHTSGSVRRIPPPYGPDGRARRAGSHGRGPGRPAGGGRPDAPRARRAPRGRPAGGAAARGTGGGPRRRRARREAAGAQGRPVGGTRVRRRGGAGGG